MILSIDTTNQLEATITVNGISRTFASHIHGRQELLSLISQQLKSQNISPEQIIQIEVNPGPGSFTGVRVGVAIANALALSWQVPIVLTGDKKSYRTVLPIYNRPANISKPKLLSRPNQSGKISQ